MVHVLVVLTEYHGCGVGEIVGVKVGVGVAVSVGVLVGVGVSVLVRVGKLVLVGSGVKLAVAVFVGVMVGLLGTQRVLPAMILVLLPMQFPACNVRKFVW
jgi:hypothetical protein